MKKNLVLSILAVFIFSCTTNKTVVEKKELVGEWKEIKGRATKNAGVKDIITDCEDGCSFTFKNDGTYFYNGACDDKKPEENGTWIYRDNILSLTTGKDNIKFSVSGVGEDKLKLSSLSINIDGNLSDNFDMGFFVILERQ